MKNLQRLFILLLFSIQSFASGIFVNQVGYLSNLPKYFYTDENVDSFYVVESTTGTVYFRDALILSVTDDQATGLTLYKGDFTTFERTGSYLIRLSNGDSSFVFNISSNVFENAYYKSLKGFYFQRCGVELTTEFAGVYHHPACHLNDGMLHSTTGDSGYVENKGGWHDAGDYGKYVVNAGVTVGTMLMAYEYFPDKFNQDDLDIPESGNSVPDILDEARFELEWLLKMQREDGGVYFKLTRENFSGFVMPQTDNATRYIYQVSSTATGDFAALMARASRLFKNYDADFSNQCLDAAELAWSFLSDNSSIVPAGGFKNPPGTATGEYGDGDDRDERLWASAELFETTSDSVYNQYFTSHYNYSGTISSTMWWGNVKDLAHLTYLLSTQSAASQTIKNNINSGLINYCNSFVNSSQQIGFGVTLSQYQYTWGCNSDVLNNAILLLFGYEQTKNEDYYNLALKQLNYILGINANNKSYVTGLGSNPVMHPHHRPSGADGITDPVPGLMAGGPDRYLDDAVLQSHYNNTTPPALCYIDDEGSYASNEIAINWNAPLVFVLGYFNSEGITDVKERGSNILPSEYKLEQNYPNPFNPNTFINYSLPQESFVSLVVFSSTGQLVRQLVNSSEKAGNYRISFDADGIASGVYFYRIKAGEFVSTKKMMLLK